MTKRTAPPELAAAWVHLIAASTHYRTWAAKQAHPTDVDELTRELLEASSALKEAERALERVARKAGQR